jgi:hypothetical protein
MIRTKLKSYHNRGDAPAATLCTALLALVIPGYSMSAPGDDACSRRFGRPGVCHVSLLSVVGSPDQYASRRIQFVGYLALDDRILTVYPNREAFIMGDRASSIELFAPYEALRKASRRWSYSYVIVTGVFTLGDSDRTSGSRLGILEEAEIVAPMAPQEEDRSNLDPVMRIDSSGDEEVNEP